MKSFVDEYKISKIPKDTIFGYRDVVQDDLDKEEHPEYGKVFKEEVENGLVDGVAIEKETDGRMLYKKLH